MFSSVVSALSLYTKPEARQAAVGSNATCLASRLKRVLKYLLSVAAINMSGRQSFLLNDIKQELRNGGNVTHILNVKVSRQRRPEEGTSIRQEIFKRIANVNLAKNVNGIPVSIKWRTTASSTSAYYHADVPLFTDIVVKRHTEQLLHDILTNLNPRFDNVFANGTTGLAFLVSKPLTREVAIGDEDEEDVDEEEDEAAENN